MRTRERRTIGLAVMAAIGIAAGVRAQDGPERKPDFPPFDKVSEGYEKVVSTADGRPSLYSVWKRDKDGTMIAELPRGWQNQKYYFAVTQASGAIFAGLQGPTRYAYWKRFDDRMALIEPQFGTRSTGDQESKSSVDRLFTDTVLADVRILSMGPSGQPVISLNELLLRNGSKVYGRPIGPLNEALASVVKAKAFPENVEVAYEAPTNTGQLQSYHFSISLIPNNTGYRPREADTRLGYFTTFYRDLGQYQQKQKWVRYINRWNIEKRDPKLKLSPPKEPIVYYIEHTVPVRYRRWVRDGILWWNRAFEKVGIDGAIEVYYQDKATGAHMDKDPEDVRFNFIRWLNNDISTAIGPSRAHPLTGQILDADVVLTDGWIRAFWGWYNEQMPEVAMQSFSPETMLWLEEHPEWDPRFLLASPGRRDEMLARRARGEPLADIADVIAGDPALLQNEDLAALKDWLGNDSAMCLAAHGRAFDMAFGQVVLNYAGMLDDPPADGDVLDGIPEWFVGPLLADLVAHEVGHTLGLRHNFKASSIYTIEQINSEEFKGKKPFTGSVMDYNPPNFNVQAGEVQGDFAMIDIGPYDYWAIEYGYTMDDPKKILERVAEPELAYLTDDDLSGSDPLARQYDFTADPLAYAQNQMRLVTHLREKLLERFVKDGESWSGARMGYQVILSQQTRVLSMMANWIGGAYVHRDHKGDPNGRVPLEVVDAGEQRGALAFVIENSFHDASFGLTEELLLHMTVDKWSDPGAFDSRGDSAWDVHDRVMGVQGSVLTMVLNPTSLGRVLDNELRTPAEQDALTLPELMQTMTGAAFTELGTDLDGVTFTNRKPMISSLRRNLQSAMIDRLTGLTDDAVRMPRPIRTLATFELKQVRDRIAGVLEKRETGQLDQYSLVHLVDLHERIDRALDRVKIAN